MSGAIKKTEIVEVNLVELAEEIHKVGVEMQTLLDILGKKPPKTESLSGIKKETEELTFNEAELAKQHQELGKLTAKLEEIKSSYNKEIVKTKLLIKQENEAIEESITGKKAEAKATKELADEEKRLAKERKDQMADVLKREKAEQKETEAINRKTEAIKKLNEAQKLQRSKLVSTVEQQPSGTVENVNSRIKLAEFDKSVISKDDKGLIDRESAFIKKLNDEKKQLIETNKKLAVSEKLAAQEEKLKLAVQAQSEGSIKRLQAENQLHAFTIRNKLNPAIASERAEILRLNKVIGTNKDAVSDMQRKNVTAWDRVTKSVFQHLAAYVGITQAIQLVKTIFNLTKELDSLHFSMGSVIKDQKELAATQSFLSDTSKKYGIDLLALSERYIKFRAATLQSNMTMKETMGIFNSMSKISAVLGLKTDEMSGVFLALEQMISKGKVTTEELRRQLGERLPGAFGIMANAVQKLHPELVVTLASLDKMLKAGTIISSEVLPEFARQAEIAFGTETTDKVNTLAAAQGRLKTSWIQFVEETKQSKNFIYLLNNLNNALSGIRYAFGGADELELYSSLTGKWGDAFSDVTKEIEKLGGAGKDFFKDATKYHDMFVTALEKTGEPLEKIEKAWTQYVKKSRLMLSEENEKAKKTTVFDPKSYKANLEDTLNEIETFNTTKDASLKEAMKRTSDLFKSGSVTDVTYLNKERNDIVKKSEDAWLKYDELQKKKTNNEKAFTKDEEIELVARYENYQGYIDARIDIDKRLKKDNSSENKTGKTKLQLAKESSEKELADFKRAEQLTLAEQAKASNELIESDDALKAALEEQKYESDQRIIAEEIRLQEELLKLTKDGSTERASIESEIAKFKEDAAQTSTDRTVDLINDEIASRKKALAQQKKDANDASKQLLSDTENNIIVEQTALTKKAGEDIKAAKGNAQKTKEIRDNLAQDMLNIELMYRKDVSTNDTLIGDDKQKNSDRIFDVEKNNEEQKLKKTEDTESAILDVKQQIFEKSAELVNSGFDLIQQGYANQLSTAEQTYNSEVDAAGDNIQERIKAERKYEKEKKRIARDQAIAEKLQAAFSIALSTAQAIIAVWANPLTLVGAPALTALIAALGAVQLASVLAQPIPAYAEGVEDFKGGLAVLGDGTGSKKGKELVIEPSGKKWLSSDMPSLYNLPKGSDVIPADETSKILANMAFNQVRETLDIGETNKYLSGIERNTRNNSSSYVDSKGRTVIKRGTVNSVL